MITENVLMEAVAAGGDRQTLHERIRVHSQAVAEVVKQQGGENDLMSRLAKDDAFAGVDLDKLADPAALTGRSSEQVDQFLAEVVEPIRHRYGAQADDESLRV
jgi:adenylosuccinate lyase